ncbi:MAG: hypothetical protein LC657_11160, partial [Desulfobacteraceae bacterium]|nr:hypothetical protein [Desulfobacteraceae bacterium]
GKPLVVSCERTVRAGGGLVKYAEMVFNQKAGCRTSLFFCKEAHAGSRAGHRTQPGADHGIECCRKNRS